MLGSLQMAANAGSPPRGVILPPGGTPATTLREDGRTTGRWAPHHPRAALDGLAFALRPWRLARHSSPVTHHFLEFPWTLDFEL
jgi:hypothetical protein